MLLEYIKLSFIIIAGVFALWQYYNHNKFIRTGNLSNIWRRFYETDVFLDLFVKFEDAEKNPGTLKAVSKKDKLKFLAFLSEVYGYAEVSQIDKNKAMRLFQWHFYYTFKNERTYPLFWDNLVEEAGADKKQLIKNEVKKSYWKKYYDFASECEHMMKQEKSIN